MFREAVSPRKPSLREIIPGPYLALFAAEFGVLDEIELIEIVADVMIIAGGSIDGDPWAHGPMPEKEVGGVKIPLDRE